MVSLIRRDEGRRIVAFYEGSAPDDRGRYVEDVLRFDDGQIENVHDFIQWLFPLRELSGANPSAPRIDDVAVEEFENRRELRDTMARALDRMLAFYGLAREGYTIVETPSFVTKQHWLTPNNHNYLRLTRIMKSLRLLGNQQLAIALFERLQSIYEHERRSGKNRIPATTFAFWKEACGT